MFTFYICDLHENDRKHERKRKPATKTEITNLGHHKKTHQCLHQFASMHQWISFPHISVYQFIWSCKKSQEIKGKVLENKSLTRRTRWNRSRLRYRCPYDCSLHPDVDSLFIFKILNYKSGFNNSLFQAGTDAASCGSCHMWKYRGGTVLMWAQTHQASIVKVAAPTIDANSATPPWRA